MPGLSGIRVMEKIKEINPEIEVILITGYASYETVLEALRLHAFDYIPKPFNVPHLRDMVKRAVIHRHSHGKLQLATEAASVTHEEALAQHTRELTAQLAAANKELEAFRDFVSHNLHTPLRTIDDLSQTLLADYAHQLDAPGKDALQRVHTTSQSTAQILEDVLSRAMQRLASTWPTLTQSLEPSSACTRG
jgi:YesN/AraC family two-component response regulator